MAIGNYRELLTRRVATASQSGANGQVTYSYADGANMWASVQEVGATEALAIGASRAQIPVKIRVRGWQTTLAFVDRLSDPDLSVEYIIGGIFVDRANNELVVSATRYPAGAQS